MDAVIFAAADCEHLLHPYTPVLNALLFLVTSVDLIGVKSEAYRCDFIGVLKVN